MCDSRASRPSCVFHGNLDRAVEEDSPLCPGEVSVFFHALENATLGFPSLYYTLHATICWTLLSQTPFGIMSGIMCSAAGPSGNHTIHPARPGAMFYQWRYAAPPVCVQLRISYKGEIIADLSLPSSVILCIHPMLYIIGTSFKGTLYPFGKNVFLQELHDKLHFSITDTTVSPTKSI
ncbi:hypothetical protein ABVT39_025087 [Epinephelus coioides]